MKVSAVEHKYFKQSRLKTLGRVHAGNSNRKVDKRLNLLILRILKPLVPTIALVSSIAFLDLPAHAITTEGTVPLRRDLVEDLLIKRLKRKVKTLTDDELATILENLMQQSSNTAFPTDLLLPPPPPSPPPPPPSPRINNYSPSSLYLDKAASNNRDRDSNATKVQQQQQQQEEDEEDVDLTRSLMMPPKQQQEEEDEAIGRRKPATPLSPFPSSSVDGTTTAYSIDPLIKLPIIYTLLGNPIGRMTISAPIIVIGAYLGFIAFKKSDDNNNSSSSGNDSDAVAGSNAGSAPPLAPSQQQQEQSDNNNDDVSKGNIFVNALAAVSTFLFSTDPIGDDDDDNRSNATAAAAAAAAASTSSSNSTASSAVPPTTSQQQQPSSSSIMPPPPPPSSIFARYTENIPTPDKNGILWRKKGGDDDEGTIKKKKEKEKEEEEVATTTKSTTILPISSHKSNGRDLWRMPLEQLKATVVVVGEETLTETEKRIMSVGEGSGEEIEKSKVEVKEEEEDRKEEEDREEVNKLEVMDNIEPAGFNGVRRRRLVVGKGQR